VRLRLKSTDRSAPTKSWNVVAELPGRTRPREWVVLGCHYDGHDIAQGAEDPASGAVAVLEAARVLAAHAAGELGCGVRFIEFGTEEIGLIGAYRYVAAHRDELAQIRFMLNMDAAGGGGRKGVTINRWPELDAFFAQARREMKTELPTGQKTGAFSDHFPFFLAGVPTGMMGDPDGVNTGRGFGHSAYDTLDKIHLDNLRAAASVACRLALRISRAESWPAKLRSKDVVQKLIDAEPNLEMMKLRPQMDALYAKKG
jgi:Zn-dependent M28 family amino/carboxypeptidase